MAVDEITSSAAHTMLSSVTSTGAGTAWSINVVAYDSAGSVNANQYFSDFTVQVVTSGSPTTVLVHIEASLDGGTTWVQVGQSIEGAGVFSVHGPAVQDVRANLVALDGGTSPAVSVYLAAVK